VLIWAMGHTPDSGEDSTRLSGKNEVMHCGF
jgi:hypothetical protein